MSVCINNVNITIGPKLTITLKKRMAIKSGTKKGKFQLEKEVIKDEEIDKKE